MSETPEFDAYLCHNSKDRAQVEVIAKWLRTQDIKVWYDKWELRPGLPWQKELEKGIVSSISVLVFIGESGLGPWHEPEMRTALDKSVRLGCPVIPVLLPGCPEKPDVSFFLKAYTWVDFRNGLNDEDAKKRLLWGITGNNPYTGQEIQTGVLDRPLNPGASGSPESSAKPITKPGFLRYFLDRNFPLLHRFLTRTGTLSQPPELNEINVYIRDLRAFIEKDIRQKTYIPIYIPIRGKEVPTSMLPSGTSEDPFIRPIHQIIRQLTGRAQGGDSASAQIAAVNRQSRVVRNIMKTLLETDDPLMLLGDPGTGKTMTLQKTAIALANSETGRVFPIVPLYIRLGEFRVDGRAKPDDVLDYVKQFVPPLIRPYVDALGYSERLVILFDGMDEMSREHYNEHTEALSLFAGSRRGMTKTLFSCRITDFSPNFMHRRLVLLPFNRSQISEFLKKYIPGFPITIDGEPWSLKRLVKRLSRGGLPMEADNPFVLWLLCFQLQNKGTWPASRVDLLRFFNEQNYKRKADDVPSDEPPFPDIEDAFLEWGRIAYTITTLDRGTAIPVQILHSDDSSKIDYVREMIRVGKRCGILVESTEGHEYLIRFEHHRFQEFFSAHYIHESQPEISWIDKLDAPRWQETMLNLVLMGGADDAVQSLADSITQPIQVHQIQELPQNKVNTPLFSKLQEFEYNLSLLVRGQQRKRKQKELQFTEEEETIIADRVELASRILRQISSDESAVRKILMSPLCETISFLADNGNPITQVKMMRTCQNIPDIDLIKTLNKPLKSPINWVRNQALMVLAGIDHRLGHPAPTGLPNPAGGLDLAIQAERDGRNDDQCIVADRQSVGSDFATEIGYDLANGLYLLRLPAYIKAVIASGNKQYWWCLTMGTFCSLANLLLLLGGAGLIYVGAVIPEMGILPWLTDILPWLMDILPWLLKEPVCIVTYIVVILFSVFLALKFDPGLLWAAIFGGAAASLAFFDITIRAWNSSLSFLLEGLFIFSIYLVRKKFSPPRRFFLQ